MSFLKRLQAQPLNEEHLYSLMRLKQPTSVAVSPPGSDYSRVSAKVLFTIIVIVMGPYTLFY
jgi:hypothetical protein